MYNDSAMPPVAVLSNRKMKIEITNIPSTLGRNEGMVDIYLFHESISRAHCVFECMGGKVTVKDLGSTAGTFINGVQLEANVPYNLEEGCKLTIGKVKLSVHVDYDELARREQIQSMKKMAYESEMRSEMESRSKSVTIDAKELNIYEYDESEVVYIDCGLRPKKKSLSYTNELRKKEIEKAQEDELKQTKLLRKEEIVNTAEKAKPAAPVTPVTPVVPVTPAETQKAAPVVVPVEKPEPAAPEAPVRKPAAVPETKKPVLMLSWIDDETGDTNKLRIDRFPFSIGRKSDENDYAVRRRGMSRKHMHFEESGGSVYLVDDNSTNGVSLNGSKVEAGRKCELKAGDSINVAEITFNVSID